MKITEDTLQGADVKELLNQHWQCMHAITPPESVHALDLNALCSADVTFWSVRNNNQLLGCGALKEISADSGEIKSMRTADAHRRKGVASALLQHIITIASQRGYQTLFLETGSMKEFSAARKLYEHYGFTACEPFADYVKDPNSTFYRFDF
jgi:putative acetyltransferase